MSFGYILDELKETKSALLNFFSAGDNDYRAPLFAFESGAFMGSDEKSIAEDRKIQRQQQKRWDHFNDDSFPASDAVARY